MKFNIVLVISLFVLTSIGCKTEQEKKPTPKKEVIKIDVASFDADYAYEMIQQQVDFGPRVPGTKAHKECAAFLKEELEKYLPAVDFQESTTIVEGNKTVPMINIIGKYQPENKNRVLLAAHWDTRPWADQDEERKDEPIDGANDGGSGVGVLLAIAKAIQNENLNIGVDFVLFDVEDYGKGGVKSWCKGSQYWAKEIKNDPKKPKYGILVDMVGGKNAVFYKEGYSRLFANHVVDKVWRAATTAGYSSYFQQQNVGQVTDDHLFVNQIARIPMIDIIQYNDLSGIGFGHFWHTHEDNMNIIERGTLKAVGQTVLQTIFEEK